MLTRRIAREIGRLDNAREQLFAVLRAYIDHGVENPALYNLMFGGYLTGPNHGRPAIDITAGGEGTDARRATPRVKFELLIKFEDSKGAWEPGSSGAARARRSGDRIIRRMPESGAPRMSVYWGEAVMPVLRSK
jgi:hypothetical protein